MPVAVKVSHRMLGNPADDSKLCNTFAEWLCACGSRSLYEGFLGTLCDRMGSGQTLKKTFRHHRGEECSLRFTCKFHHYTVIACRPAFGPDLYQSSLLEAHLVLAGCSRFVRVIGRGGFGVVKMVRAKKTGVRSRSEFMRHSCKSMEEL